MKVLVIDDSVVFRSAIKQALLGSEIVNQVEIAANGKIGIDKMKSQHFDSVTLDLEMPVLSGLDTIKAIREFDKEIPIIIFSAQSISGANKTLEALQWGADDFVSKLTGSNDINENLKMIQQELIPRFNALIARKKRKKELSKNEISPVKNEKESQKLDVDKFRADIVCMASSTGGPELLIKFFSGLKKLRVPVLLVQHMPPVFTTQLAKALDACGINTVIEAKHGDILKAGHVYLAPGDYHMCLTKAEDGQYQTVLNQDEKVCYVRPAADVLFQSVAENFNGNIAGFVFTGMGNDGAAGCQKIKDRKGIILIQDEASCVVWGMPRAVSQKSLQDCTLSPDKLIEKMNLIAGK